MRLLLIVRHKINRFNNGSALKTDNDYSSDAALSETCDKLQPPSPNKSSNYFSSAPSMTGRSHTLTFQARKHGAPPPLAIFTFLNPRTLLYFLFSTSTASVSLHLQAHSLHTSRGRAETAPKPKTVSRQARHIYLAHFTLPSPLLRYLPALLPATRAEAHSCSPLYRPTAPSKSPPWLQIPRASENSKGKEARQAHRTNTEARHALLRSSTQLGTHS